MYGQDFSDIFFRYRFIAHYYGDYVRILFVAAAILWAIVTPVWGDLLPFGLLFEVMGLLFLVVLAGLTSPHGKWTMLYDVAISGIGVLLFESAAVSFYSTQVFELFVAREAMTLLFLFALYFSIKTFRAMSAGKIGKIEPSGEFEDSQ